MKQVVNNKTTEVVELMNVSDDYYYGFILNVVSPGYIAADNMSEVPHTFQARFFYSMTAGNPWGPQFKTLKECIEFLINGHGCVVYEFKTYQELLKWGSEQ